ncbi:hypothetical protein GCM10029992_08070 [Glycomyces albus]
MNGSRSSYDIFLCYKWENQQTAMELRDALSNPRYGFEVFLDCISGRLWEPLQSSIIEALDNSKTLLALITPEFPASPHCRTEVHRALTAAYHLGDGDTSRVVAIAHGIAVRDVRPKQLKAYRMPSDGTPEPETLEEIAAIVRRQDDRFGDAPDFKKPDWYPYPVVGDSGFQGRYSELWDLHTALGARERNSDRAIP